MKNNENEINLIKHKNNILDITLLSDITKDSYNCFFNNTFIQFKTFDNLHYLIYNSKNNSIVCIDLYKKQKITEIKNAKDENNASFRHYPNKAKKQDLILTISPKSCNLRIWDVKNWQCILYINKVYNYCILYSACMMNENDNYYIVTSSCNYFGDSELIKIFDFKGNKIKEINNSNDATLLIDIYYDKKNNKKYIITTNKNYLKSFDYINNNSYIKYYDNNNGAHSKYVIDDSKNIVKLFDPSEDGNLRIWNFHTGELLNKINISKQCLYDICFWDENFLLIGSQDKEIKIFDLNKNEVVKCLIGHNNHVITIKKINHEKYGECLISHGFENDQIKIWTFKNEKILYNK